MSVLNNPYDESYYHSNNYSDYMERLPRYRKLASEIEKWLDSMKLINSTSKILDFGCGPGFLVRSLSDLGFERIFGFDISPWATKKAMEICHPESKIFFRDDAFLDARFDFTFFMDVLEHIKVVELNSIFTHLRSNFLIVRIPVANVEGSDFVLSVSRNDPTHVTCWTKHHWNNFLEGFGFNLHCLINLNNVYDTEGVFCALYRNALWRYEKI